MLSINSKGNVRTTTMRAWDEAEAFRVHQGDAVSLIGRARRQREDHHAAQTCDRRDRGAVVRHRWRRRRRTWPDRPIKFIVHVAAGGGVDLNARILADRLNQQLPQRVLIENMGGAGGAIAARQVAKAEPDGYTFLFAGPGHAAVPFMHKQPPYDPIDDFIPVTLVTQVSAGDGDQSERAGEEPRRVHRAAEGRARQAHVRIERRRRLVAHPGRDVRPHAPACR